MAINPDPGLKGYTEVRRDLMHLADEINKMRLDLGKLMVTFSECTASLVQQSDKLWPQSDHERDADGDVKKEFKTNTDVRLVHEHINPGQRKCSICEQPGHRAPTCPDAHKARAADKAEKEARPTPPEKEPGKRYCGNCGFPGHRAKNCKVPAKAKKKRGAK